MGNKPSTAGRSEELATADHPFPVFIGYDSHEDVVFEVAKFSMEKRSSVPLDVQRISQVDLEKRGVWKRKQDPKQSTQFTYSRFYIPYVQNYKGWAYFCDDDFLWLGDFAELIDHCDDKYAIMCVQHDYKPTETSKLRGCEQAIYPRKNWSSSFLINCGHPANAACTLKLLNEAPAGGFLHRFSWIKDDSLIGELPMKWNFLVGWHDKFTADQGTPGAIHYTLGGPWYPDYREAEGNVTDYQAEWWEDLEAYEATLPSKRLLCPHELYSENGHKSLQGYPNSNAAYDEEEHWIWYGGSMYGGGGYKSICGQVVKTNPLTKWAASE
eukprot:CAMPEP_0198197304 /NCGR_PEP_ID=MMETSP1445-20131203/910_1 /TAXON_ID=36898 /ORGANISM="Pyramimonas sp., Strain CCMP2087" /LENGTH=324 /DNA_ID=CAMNT_0043866557 /DNA_START=66 /DNA_END=1040 /DNA_ORIENTATION=-